MRLHIRGRAADAIVLLFAQPNLATSKQRHADKTAHFELLAAFGDLHLDAVNLAGFGIEYLAALILFALLRKTRKDRHAEHRLVVPSAIALVALGRWVVPRLRKDFLDSAFEPAIYFSNANQAPWLAGVVVDGFPKTDGRQFGGGERRNYKE